MSKAKREANRVYGQVGGETGSEMGSVAESSAPVKRKKAPRDVYYMLNGVNKSTGNVETVKSGRTVGEIRKVWRDSRQLLDNVYSGFTLLRCKVVDLSVLDKVITRARREGGNSVPEVPKTVA